jgi:hypothetical protein
LPPQYTADLAVKFTPFIVSVREGPPSSGPTCAGIAVKRRNTAILGGDDGNGKIQECFVAQRWQIENLPLAIRAQAWKGNRS